MDLKAQLMEAIPRLTERDFSNHATDLYVVAYPEVNKWLKENYLWWKHVRGFVSQQGSDWNGEGKFCYEIPFAYWRHRLEQRPQHSSLEHGEVS